MSTELFLIKHMVVSQPTSSCGSHGCLVARGAAQPPGGGGAAEGRGGSVPPLWVSNSGCVPGLTGKLEPLSSPPDGKIRCRERLQTTLKAHDSGVLTCQCKASTQELWRDAEAGNMQ